MSSPALIDFTSFPATATLFDQGEPRPVSPPYRVSLAAATNLASQIVAHAMRVGDQATASLMAEAFSRLALVTPDPALGDWSEATRNRACTALQAAANDLIKCAYPSAWEQRQLALDASGPVSIDLSDIIPREDKGPRDNVDDDLAELFTILDQRGEVN